MINKKILLPLFIIVALLQLYVPAKMILNQEEILETGKLFKFKTAPIDPNDPFRGKYITLSFDRTNVPVEVDSIWKYNEKAFAIIAEDSAGFAYPISISKEEPTEEKNYLKVTVSSTYNNQAFINYPFTRFYMEEYKAPEAETTYRQAQRDTTTVAYALVAVKSGEAVLKDVLIDHVPIREVVEKARKEN